MRDEHVDGHNRQVAETAAMIAHQGLDRALADATDVLQEDYFAALTVAVKRATDCRPPAETLFVCLAVSAILADRASDLMPVLRDAIFAHTRPDKPSPRSAVSPSDN